MAVTLDKQKCREVILSLVSAGAHLDFRTKDGLTAMHKAAITGNTEAVKVQWIFYTTVGIQIITNQTVGIQIITNRATFPLFYDTLQYR